MNERIEQLMRDNQSWAEQFEINNPGFFSKIAKQQSPETLWIGCSDSRAPADTLLGAKPGEVFVHRNIANLVNHSDLSVLSVLEYAVNALKVKDIILCGHYDCGGVKAAMQNCEHGIVDNWLLNVKNSYHAHQEKFAALETQTEKTNLMCELNVVEQVRNICHTPIVQNAWLSGQELSVHGMILDLEDGTLKDMKVSTSSIEEIDQVYRIK